MKKLTIAEVREFVAEGFTIIANGVGLPPVERARLNEIVTELNKTTVENEATETE